MITDPSFYQNRLDALWDTFGSDKVIFGSDWPNSDHVTSLSQTVSLVRGYMAKKSAGERIKFFFSNSQIAYRWKPRRPDQSPRS